LTVFSETPYFSASTAAVEIKGSLWPFAFFLVRLPPCCLSHESGKRRLPDFRALTTCHLANIAIRPGRKLTWDTKAERILGDAEADAWQRRPQRTGYQIQA